MKIKDSWSKPGGLPGLIGRKRVDRSIFSEGTTIPHEFYADFIEANGGYALPRGEKREVTLVLGGQEFPARLESREQGPEQWRLLYRGGSSELRELLRQQLHISFEYLEAEFAARPLAPGEKAFVTTDDDHAEYVDFYATGTPFRYQVELVQAALPDFDQVWADLSTIIGSGATIKTLSRGASNRVTFSGDGIRVTAKREDFLPKAWFQEAWTTFGRNKFLTEQILPSPVKFRSTAVFAVLAQLPYVGYITTPQVTLILSRYRYTGSEFSALPIVKYMETARNHQNALLLVRLKAVEGDTFICTGPETVQVFTNPPAQVFSETLLRGGHTTVFREEEDRLFYIGRPQVVEITRGPNTTIRIRPRVQDPPPSQPRAWIFQSNPKIYDAQGAVAQLPELGWLVNRHIKEIKPGHTVFLWVSGEDAGIIAQATILTEPGPMVVGEDEAPFYRNHEKFGDNVLRVKLRVDRVLQRRVTRKELQLHPALKELSILRGPLGTNFAVTDEEADALVELTQSHRSGRFLRIGLPQNVALSAWTRPSSLDDLLADEMYEPLGVEDKVVVTRGESEVLAAGEIAAASSDAQLVWDVTCARRVPRMRRWAASAVSELTAEAYAYFTSPNPPRLAIREIAKEFADALRTAHIRFGARHDEVVRDFISSLATKPLAILTGLSGSGKTQIALRFGQWLGKDRYLVVPVRPDWTGPEALLGYEDALQKGADGRPCWQVPEALAFMLRAAADPYNPYLLILDEMNLAHVERYFADVLSGLESFEPCLPNLKPAENGKWQVPADAPAALPLPDNLFVVGTVNVDETTYMFSPKVLDRAFTFEFRVDTEDLSSDMRRPVAVPSGPQPLVHGFLALASDEHWHVEHGNGSAQQLTDHMKILHALLTEGGFEFGHRVLYEGIRFTTVLMSAGEDGYYDALDLLVLQKILPRLHGTRKRLEPTLCALGQYCHDLTYKVESVMDGSAPTRFNPLIPPAGSTPLLYRSFQKIRRMTRGLRANQFTSFTEQ